MTASGSLAPRSDPGFEALVEALLARLRRGEALDAAALAREHPAHAERLAALVPVLALVERVKARPEAAPAAAGREAPSEAPSAPPPHDLPARLGPWRLGPEIGRGGMGRVLAAVDAEGRRAAIKVIHPHLVALPGIVERFLREAEAGRRVEHPRVVRTLDAGRVEVAGRDTPWIALEHVEGRTLRDVLTASGALTERLARSVGQGLAEALAAVHAAGLVHRDVKPENVLLTAREEVRLMDLGLARLDDDDRRATRSGDFVGTLLYAAPEQLHGARVGPAADLFALGLVLHELVAGALPERTLDGAGLDVRCALAARASPWYAALVEALLAPDPARRPASAAEVATVLAQGERSAWWGARSEGGGARRRRAERPAPLVGREDDLARLGDAWDAARRGCGRVLLIEGEPGLGKSRLVDEWLDVLEAAPPAGLRWAVAEHAVGHAGSEGAPVAAALRALLGRGDPAARLAVLLDEGAALAPALAAHLEGRVPPDGVALPPASLATALRLTLRGLAREGPVVLVAEDLEAAPESSRAAFLALARGLEHERALLVATSGPGLPEPFARALRALPWTETLALQALGRDASHDLFLAALGDAASSAPWHDAVQASGGNPLCLLEWARAARAGAAPSTPPRVPDALRQLLERRLAALDPGLRHLLALAALAGERFDPALVVDAAGLGRLEGLQRLHQLDRDHALLASDGDAYRFRHAVARSLLDADLPPALRREIHGALARAVRAQAPSPEDGARAAAFVHHALAGPQPEQAVERAEEALAHLAARQRPRRLAALCEGLLALPAGALPPRLDARARIELGASRMRIDAPDAAIPHLEQGLARARALGDDALVLAAALRLAQVQSDAGRPEEALETLAVGQAAAERRGAATDLVQAALGRFELLHDLGRMGEAGEVAAQAQARAAATGDPWLVAHAAYAVGVNRLEAGDLAAGRAALEPAARAAQALGDGSLETSALTALGKADHLEGRLASARSRLERLIALAREQGELRSELITRVNLATLDVALGRPRDARAQASRALDAARAAGYTSILRHAASVAAAASAHEGRWADADALLEEAARAAEALASPLVEAKVAAQRVALLAWAGRFDEALALHRRHAAAAPALREGLALDAGLAQAHAARGDAAAAADLLHRVVAQADALGLRQEGARWRLELALAESALERHAEACRALEQVRTRAERMEARGLAAQALVHRAALPGGDTVLGRVALGEHAEALGTHAHLRAAAALAAATGDPALRLEAARSLQHLVAHAPPAWHLSLTTAVPLHRALAGVPSPATPTRPPTENGPRTP